MRQLAGHLVCLALLAGCGGGVKLHAPDTYPTRLSEWGLFDASADTLVISEQTRRYELNEPLFSDHALKLRTLYLPPGTAARYVERDAFDLPVGSIVTKTFFYQRGAQGAYKRGAHRGRTIDRSRHDLVETRLLVRQADGWDALPYVWQGDEAVLDLTGELIPMAFEDQNFVYSVPSRNECGSCHVTDHTAGSLQPIGLKARHLPAAFQQALAAEQLLTAVPTDIPQAAPLNDPMASIDERARAYLDINCGHCHNAQGAADTSGLLLDYHTESLRALGRCKPPIASGRGSGNRAYGIVPGAPDESILIYRMGTTAPGERMPEVGRALPHEQGIEVLRQWIAQLPGQC